jgi:aminopeptidase N
VTVQVNTEAHLVIARFIPSARNPELDVGADVVNSLAFFTNMYGPPLFHQYYATEIPYFHGQAFPGMIHLSWATYLNQSEQGNDESFRAHEMAHQWWGIGVEPANYRDAWLAEGFAEFSGLWYMQTILNDNEKYLKKLRDSRGAIRRAREKSAPLGLGYRAAESWRGAYALTTYQKGAWVLQMLRNLLLDTRTMSEERFSTMMHHFYATYRGRRASTADFQHTVELALGQNMDWFFNEWVYGTAIPTYTFSWTAARDSAGTVAHLRVRQSDVPSDFAMYVPVLIKLDAGDVLIRILVRGDTTNTTVRLPAEPVSMQLNPLESVLAEVKTEGWHP